MKEKKEKHRRVLKPTKTVTDKGVSIVWGKERDSLGNSDKRVNPK